jgi:hypothetical protein
VKTQLVIQLRSTTPTEGEANSCKDRMDAAQGDAPLDIRQ